MVCFECDDPADHHHHVVPKSLGGTRTVPLCGACHATVHDTGITTSDLTSRAMRRKAAKGEYIGGQPPYGYRVSACGVMLEPDGYEQSVIAEMMRLRAQGLSIRKVADRLTDAGFRSRRGRAVSKSSVARVSAAFSTGTVHRVLKEERLADGSEWMPSTINRIIKRARVVDESSA